MLSPQLAQMPLPMQRYDDPLLPFSKAIMNATRDLVCAYVFDFAAYLALGAAGAIALERSIAYAGTDDATVTILDAPFVGSAYVDAAVAFGMDAVTLVSETDAEAYRAAGIEPLIVSDGLEEALGRAGMRLVGREALHAGRGDDFAEQVRAAVQAQP